MNPLLPTDKVPPELDDLRERVGEHIDAIQRSVAAIRDELAAASPGKLLKGGEWVGWLGEAYIALLYGGTVEPTDTLPFDVELPDGATVSVKTRRRGAGTNWRTTGTLPCERGTTDPHEFDYLGFVLLDPAGHLEGIWMLPWAYLQEGNRLMPSKPNGVLRGYKFTLREYDTPYRAWPPSR